MSAGSRPWTSSRRVLCVRLDTIGDVLMTEPAIRAVRQAVPGRRVTLLTSCAGAEAGSMLGCVDEVIAYDAPWLKATPPRPDAGVDRRMTRELEARGFDAAVIFTVFSQSPLPAALTCFMAGVPLRAAHCRENPYQLLTDWVPEADSTESARHEVRRQLDLAAAVGCSAADERIRVGVGAARAGEVAGLLDRLEGSGPLVVVHPGASAPSRRYPPEGFAAAARMLHDTAGARVVLSGSGDERRLVAEVAAATRRPCLQLAGELDLQGLAAVLSAARVLVTNNTGPAHLAAAVGTPVVDLYALTNPQHAPWRVPSRVLFHDVPCRFCYKSSCPRGHHACLEMVEPREVAEAAMDLMREGRLEPAGGVVGG